MKERSKYHSTRITHLFSLVAFAVVIGLHGCSRDKGDQPRAVADPHQLGLAAVSADDLHVDAGIVGAAASAEEVVKPGAAAAAQGPAVQIDQSTPEATAKSYVDVINSGQIAQLTALVAQDQQQPVTDLAGVVTPITQAAAQLQKALGEKFAGHAFVMSIQNDAVPADWLKRWTVAGIDPDANDPNTATAKLQVENGTDTATRTLKKTDDKWRVQEANLPTADQAKSAQETLTQLADAFKGLAGRVEGGELADADAAEKEIASVIANPGAAPAAAEAKPAPAKAKPAPARPAAANADNARKPERSKSELEQDMDSAAGRTVIGGGAP